MTSTIEDGIFVGFIIGCLFTLLLHLIRESILTFWIVLLICMFILPRVFGQIAREMEGGGKN